ncbi:GNAT family N-acetyltransferase [Paenibacillus lignilyticus]|uniref:GNAT family N-acetyltransferase n=1 Tax=Paenibacillus lignilyticus TaxID=1172615 RepID=A0ABS5CJI3_9BACL|nr:GNAT family N-acetyltransferase [Paenibacillus lignilyticus]MBP3966033.1 GNAT family N-acetyltransferase [Paenibacillus lignilyticus]
MKHEVEIERITSIIDHRDELSELLAAVVQDGASLGFLPPLSHAEAAEYWAHVPAPDVRLYIATMDNRIVGSVQVHLCMKPNGGHRAEIAKLMAHPEYRRMGIGRMLMQTAEADAKGEGRSLIVLDTREGDPSNLLYTSMGYIQAGRIPDYAMSADGGLAATIMYYKLQPTDSEMAAT